MGERGKKFFSIEDVTREEQRIIKRRRQRLYPEQNSADGVGTNLIGVALSGGGIRSAVTNLGVLYEMSRVGLFKAVDYLSTVSGGGYIGCCISSLLSIKQVSTEEICDDNLYTYSSVVQPPSLFTTDWRSFPFRDLPVIEDKGKFSPCADSAHSAESDRGSCRYFDSKDQIYHLRNRASFLLPRSLPFGAHVMKAFGAVFTSSIMSLIWFFSLIFFISSLYMFVSFSEWNSSIDGLGHSVVQKVQQELKADNRSGRSAEGKKDENELGSIKAILAKATGALAVIKDQIVIQFRIYWELNYKALVAGLGVLWGICSIVLVRLINKIYSTHTVESEDLEQYIARKQLKYVSISTGLLLSALLIGLYWLVQSVTYHPDPRLLYPFTFCISALTTCVFVYCCRTAISSSWNRKMRSELAMNSGLFFYFSVGSFLFALLPSFILAGNQAFLAMVLALLIVVLRSNLQSGNSTLDAIRGEGFGVMFKKIARWCMGILVPLFILLAVIGVATLLRDVLFILCENGNQLLAQFSEKSLRGLGVIIGASATLSILLSFLNFNRISPHVFYRDRLAEAFLVTVKRCGSESGEPCEQANRMEMARNSVEMNLTDLHGNIGGVNDGSVDSCAARGPYLLINGTLNLTAVRDLYGFRRQSTNFLFSRCFTGSDRTGYIPTNMYDPPLELGRAMTISGAAITSVRGAGGTMAESFGCTILGVRLGYWLQNPVQMIRKGGIRVWNWKNLFFELFRYTTSRHSHVYLSDGGHCGDNLGLLPLMQRKVKLLIASDAECDPEHEFNSLNSSIRRAYVDHNIKVSISLDDITPDSEGDTKRHYTIGRVFYPDRPWQKSWLLIIKNTMTGEESAPIRNYKKKSPTFPHETTADQFFTEEQFEVYRSLGREACSAIWMENIAIFRSRKWLESPWECIDEFCENLDRLCNPKKERKISRKARGKNCWDDIIRSIWKSERGDFSSWEGFARTIAELVSLHERTPSTTFRPKMVAQLYELHHWLQENKDQLKSYDREHDIPRLWTHFKEIRKVIKETQSDSPKEAVQ